MTGEHTNHSLACPEDSHATCGNCGLEWCDMHDPCPAAMCPVCNGRGYTTAAWGEADRPKTFIVRSVETVTVTTEVSAVTLDAARRAWWDARQGWIEDHAGEIDEKREVRSITVFAETAAETLDP